MSGNEYFPILSNLFFLGCGSLPEPPAARPIAEGFDVGAPPDVTRALMEIVGGENRASPLSKPSSIVRDVGLAVGANRDVTQLFGRLPPSELKENEIAIRRLRHFTAHARLDSAHGTYAGFLTRSVFEDILRKGSLKDLRKLLHYLADGATLAEYERFAATLLNPPPFMTMASYKGLSGLLRDLVLPPEALETLATALRVAAASPMALLRVYRIEQLLESRERTSPDLFLSKIAELGDRDCRLMGRDSLKSLSKVRNRDSQRDAYFDDPQAALLLTLLERFRNEPDRKRIGQAAERRRTLAAVLRNPWSPGEVTPADVSRAFRLLEDPISLRIARAIEDVQISLHVLEPAAFEMAVRECAPSFDRNAFYRPAGTEQRLAVLYVRRRPLGPKSSFDAEDTLFDVMASIVRRFRIHADSCRTSEGGGVSSVRLEFRALLDEVAWRSLHGDRRLLDASFDDGALGPALYLRDQLDPVR